MDITKDFKVKRIIQSIDLGYNIVAYKDCIYIDGSLKKSSEGITESYNLSTESLDPIPSDETYLLLQPEFLESWHTNYLEPWEIKTENPYTSYAENHSLIPVRYDSYTSDLYLLDGSLCPKAQYYGYLNGCIDDASFDLDELERYLRTRPDSFQEIKRKRIPYYNREENRTEEVSFLWIPTKEEYQDFRNKQNEKYDVLKRNAISIMGLDQFRIKNSEY